MTDVFAQLRHGRVEYHPAGAWRGTQNPDRERGHEQDRAEQQGTDGGVAEDRQARDRRQPGETGAHDEQDHARRNCGLGHSGIGVVTPLQRTGWRLSRRAARRQPRADRRDQRAHREEQQQRPRRGPQCRAEYVQLAVAQVAGHQAQHRRREQRSAGDAEHGADRPEGRPLADQCALELPSRQAQRAQQRERFTPPQYRQGLGREDEKGAGPQRHQREHIEIHAVGARDGDRPIAFDIRRDREYAGRQMSGQFVLRAADIAARRQAQVDAIDATDPPEDPLRGRDVHEAERLRIGVG